MPRFARIPITGSVTKPLWINLSLIESVIVRKAGKTDALDGWVGEVFASTPSHDGEEGWGFYFKTTEERDALLHALDCDTSGLDKDAP